MEFVLDSYAWFEYLGGNQKYAPYIEGTKSELPTTVSISLTEIVRGLLRKGHSKAKVLEAVKFVCEKSNVLEVGRENAISAGFIAEQTGLHFSDALIYSFAGENNRLVTGDKHFKQMKNVEFIE